MKRKILTTGTLAENQVDFSEVIITLLYIPEYRLTSWVEIYLRKRLRGNIGG